MRLRVLIRQEDESGTYTWDGLKVHTRQEALACWYKERKEPVEMLGGLLVGDGDSGDRRGWGPERRRTRGESSGAAFRLALSV